MCGLWGSNPGPCLPVWLKVRGSALLRAAARPAALHVFTSEQQWPCSGSAALDAKGGWWRAAMGLRVCAGLLMSSQPGCAAAVSRMWPKGQRTSQLVAGCAALPAGRPQACAYESVSHGVAPHVGHAALPLQQPSHVIWRSCTVPASPPHLLYLPSVWLEPY